MNPSRKPLGSHRSFHDTLREQFDPTVLSLYDETILTVRNWWIDLQVRWMKPLSDKYPYCLVGGSQAELNKFALFHFDEAFTSPCTLNEVWCGTVRGRWTPKIAFMWGTYPDE